MTYCFQFQALICTVQKKRDLLQNISKQREAISKQIDVRITNALAEFAD